ncbi:hypothetical protein [Pseudomonas sp.]|uniref:hypothetical protein n=1 Tax=Pseudomonas sp. TaxID=306 RepID=UPI0028ABFA20|nr:hypothetical protein [Pseudomonas sp.]
MSETEQAISSLRSSIDALHSFNVTLQTMASSKAESSFVSELASRVTSCEARVAALGSSVEAQGPAVSTLTSRVATECEARAHADTALAARVDFIQCVANSPAELHVKPEEAVEPLRMGMAVFHGETARAIRDAQAVLKAANVGQLEVVKRANEAGKPFVVIDGQVFISDASIKSGDFVVKSAPVDPGQLLSEIAKQVIESEVGADLGSRIAEIEKAGASQGAESRALHDRLQALELSLVALRGQLDAARVSPNKP